MKEVTGTEVLPLRKPELPDVLPKLQKGATELPRHIQLGSTAALVVSLHDLLSTLYEGPRSLRLAL
jgi:hypothetical protein